MSRRHHPEGTRLLSGGNDSPDAYSYGSIKRDSFFVSPSKYVWAKRDFVLISIVLVTALLLVTVTLSLGLPRITLNRSRHLMMTSPSIEQAAFVTQSSTTIRQSFVPLLTGGRLNFEVGPS